MSLFVLCSFLLFSRVRGVVNCLFCSKGTGPAAGFCKSFDCGGTSGVHFYACCNFAGTTCDGIEYDGASDGDYCGPSGENKGDGCDDGGDYTCRGCDGATACKKYCDENAVSFVGACWNWLKCFELCCKDKNGPINGVDGWIEIKICNEDDRRKLHHDACGICQETWGAPGICSSNGDCSCAYCGDGICEGGECCGNCPEDCGGCLSFPFGLAVGDTETGPNDSGSGIPIGLTIPMLFYGQTVKTVFQNTNGDITFDSPSGSDLPENLPDESIPLMIAIYWTNIDTRNGGDNQNGLFIRASSDPGDATTAGSLVHRLGGEATLFDPTATVVATWNRVEASSRLVGKQNTFQLIVAYNDQQTYVIFAYHQLEFWEGLSSNNTVIGFNNDIGIEIIATLESNEDMLALLVGTNVGVPGTYIYRVDQPVVTNAPCKDNIGLLILQIIFGVILWFFGLEPFCLF